MVKYMEMLMGVALTKGGVRKLRDLCDTFPKTRNIPGMVPGFKMGPGWAPVQLILYSRAGSSAPSCLRKSRQGSVTGRLVNAALLRALEVAAGGKAEGRGVDQARWELVQPLYWECMKFLPIVHNSDPSRTSVKYLGRP